jgi:hypothetical protein
MIASLCLQQDINWRIMYHLMNLINVLVKLIVRGICSGKVYLLSFGNLELLQKQHDIYVTPHPIEIPYYLCIKTSILVHDIATILNKKSIDNVYGKKELEHEYWFSVPKEK